MTDMTPPAGVRSPPGTACVPVDSRTSETDEDVPDPMVSELISPFIIPVTIRHPGTGKEGDLGALIDSGCTQCLIRHLIVEALGVRIVNLKKPITFKQMDGSTLGSSPATHVIEPIHLKIREHWEHIRFVTW